MAPSADNKRKAPPTFAHLPKHRAKKLKQAWVDKQKMKSKWKAQKRREGLSSSKPGATHNKDADSASLESSEKDNASDISEDDGVSQHEDWASDASGPSPADVKTSHLNAARARGKAVESVTTPEDRDKEIKDKTSLRELRKQAYSASSLHPFRSDPLHRKAAPVRGTSRGNGRGAAAGRGGRGTGAARGQGRGTNVGDGDNRTVRGGGRGRGRGQPDMRLRMNMMLEQIKRDYT